MMDGHDRSLYIGAVSLLVRFHAAMGSSVTPALDKRQAFDADGDPLARLAADFNGQGFGLVMEENGETWAIVDRPKPAAAPLPVAGEPEVAWSPWYQQARDKAKEYGLRGIPRDTYREHWLMGSSVAEAVQQIRLQTDPDAYKGSARGDHR